MADKSFVAEVQKFNRITIPIELRKLLKISNGDLVTLVLVKVDHPAKKNSDPQPREPLQKRGVTS